jgi:hypothetical protein
VTQDWRLASRECFIAKGGKFLIGKRGFAGFDSSGLILDAKTRL